MDHLSSSNHSLGTSFPRSPIRHNLRSGHHSISKALRIHHQRKMFKYYRASEELSIYPKLESDLKSYSLDSFTTERMTPRTVEDRQVPKSDANCNILGFQRFVRVYAIP